MKSSLRWTSAVLLLALAVLAVALAAALQEAPAVAGHEDVGPRDAARAMALLRAHDPRRAMPGTLSVVSLNERDLEVLFNHGARRWGDARSRIRLERGVASVTVSGRVPANPFGRWINVESRWVQTGGLPAIESVRIGRLPIPVWLGERLALELVDRAGLLGEWQLSADVVRRVRFMPQQLQVTYAWGDDGAERVLQALLPAPEQQRLRAYAERLAELSQGLKPAWEVPLVRLLGPMFALAQTRTAAGGDAAAENRAAIVVLTLFANGRRLPAMRPAAQEAPRARPLRLTLAGRDDFPLHFLVSAALVVETSGVLARSIGSAKELADARGGSGFSFKDMAANRAGTRFGERAVRAPQALQALLAQGVDDNDLMPAWSDLPEFLPEAEFMRRFGGVGAPPYEAAMAEIERRIDALRLFR